MSESSSLTELFKRAVEFRHAFELKMEFDGPLERKLIASLCDDDNKTGNRLSGRYFDEVLEALQRAVLAGEQIDGVSNAAATSAIQLAEYTARLALRAAAETELSTLAPAQSRSAEVSRSFAAHNAPTLATLFSPKGP
jgi:hypothetical protein